MSARFYSKGVDIKILQIQPTFSITLDPPPIHVLPALDRQSWIIRNLKNTNLIKVRLFYQYHFEGLDLGKKWCSFGQVWLVHLKITPFFLL